MTFIDTLVKTPPGQYSKHLSRKLCKIYFVGRSNLPHTRPSSTSYLYFIFLPVLSARTWLCQLLDVFLLNMHDEIVHKLLVESVCNLFCLRHSNTTFTVFIFLDTSSEEKSSREKCSVYSHLAFWIYFEKRFKQLTKVKNIHLSLTNELLRKLNYR